MKYIIIGNSAAGIGTVEGIRQLDKTGEITVISDEPYHTYSRPLISYLLLGKVTEETMKYRPDSFYADNHCTLLHAKVTKIDSKNKRVFTETGASAREFPYDKLLVATGSSPFVPPFEGLDTVQEKYTFMSLDDARKIDAVLDKSKRVLIIGAGLIGLKCAEGILDRVNHITVLDLAPRILSSILDDEGAKIVQTHLESKGIEFRLGCTVKRFEKDSAVLAGESLPPEPKVNFDILVLAVGVRPNTALLDGIAEIDRGIVVNDKSETNVPDIYAAGDCTQSLDISSGQMKVMALLPNAYMQGECAGINMAGNSVSEGTCSLFNKAIPMNAIGFCGLHIITAGNYTGNVYVEESGVRSQESGGDGRVGDSLASAVSYKRLFYSDNKLNGYILIGDVDKAGIYTSLIRERTPLDTLDFALVCKKPGLMAFGKEERMNKLGKN